MLKPFSKNIVFLDTEFSSLDIKKGEILSLGIIKYNGEKLYLEFEFNGEIDEWPRKNILPYLTEDKISKEQAKKQIEKFIGQEKLYVVAYVNQFDMIYLYKQFGLEYCNDIFNWIPIDFASILFSLNINPNSLVNREQSFFNEFDIDLSKYEQHNALDDAKLLREVYMKLIK
ncbi:3'-5' exoribonuclease [Candidatus Parcubacteria bacterium]|nr:3'-5' exoribonuclease [Candidatus Parcubacteria bacterium]